MDHAHAQIIECPNRGMEIRVVNNDFTHQAKQESLQKGELHMHHKEQQQQAKYYANLAEVIRHYKDVVLFGPTDAKKDRNSLFAPGTISSAWMQER